MKPLDALTSGLASDDPLVAGDAARLLGELGNNHTVPALVKYVKRCRHHYKSAGLVALGILGQSLEGKPREELAATLRQQMAQPNVHDDWYWYSCRGVRAAAALALLTMSDESGASYLRELADKQDDVFFCWFAPAILKLEKTVPATAELQSRITPASILTIGTHKTRNTEPGLLTMKAQVLGILKGPEACAALEKLTKFHSRYVRGQATLSLLQASDAPAHIAIVESLADSDPTDFVKIKASLALALQGQSQRADDLAKAAANVADPFDRAVAVESLGLLGRKKDAAVIRRQLARPDPYLRQCALEALERIDPESAADAAAKMTKDSSARVRLQAAKILAGVKNAHPQKARSPKTPARKPASTGARK